MVMIAQTVGLLEGLAIILSVVSLIITVVGFFASLKFYRDGVDLQRSANDALTKLEEKTEFIQTQVGEMFGRTLDAAIGKREMLSNNFEEINEQLEKTKAKLIEESIGQIGVAGEQERKRLAQIVDSQMAMIREKVENTRESAEKFVKTIPSPLDMFSLGPSSKTILEALIDVPGGLTAKELAEKTGIDEEYLRRRLWELKKRKFVELEEGKYSFHVVAPTLE
jgi:hypothetical protein